MSFLAAAIVGSAVVGSVMSSNAASKQRKQTAAIQKANLTTAQEATRLKKIKMDAGAKVKIGTVDTSQTSALKKRRATTPRAASGSIVGGVSASKIGGL